MCCYTGLLLNANWSIVSDMTLYIVIPPRRGIASATQILVSHMFGDAFSPYLIGAMADTFKPLISPNTTVVSGEHHINFMHSGDSRQLTPEQYDLEFRALEYSLFSCCFFQVGNIQLLGIEVGHNVLFQALGAFFFFVVSWYVISDKLKAERQIACNADILGPENGHSRYGEDVDYRESTQPIYRGPSVET